MVECQSHLGDAAGVLVYDRACEGIDQVGLTVVDTVVKLDCTAAGIIVGSFCHRVEDDVLADRCDGREVVFLVYVPIFSLVDDPLAAVFCHCILVEDVGVRRVDEAPHVEAVKVNVSGGRTVFDRVDHIGAVEGDGILRRIFQPLLSSSLLQLTAPIAASASTAIGKIFFIIVCV